MRAVLLDEHKAFRDCLRIALQREASVSVVGDASTAREIYPVIEAEKPDLVITELMLKDTDGVSLARELNRRGAKMPMLILTMYSNAVFVRHALETGVLGYALKEQPLSEVIAAVRAVANGTRYVSPLLGQVPMPRLREGNALADEGQTSGLDQLSHREREIFCRIIQGLSSRDIARALCISLKTVETHRSHINRKLGVHSPSELIRLAALQGLLSRNGTALDTSTGANAVAALTANATAATSQVVAES